MLPIDANGFACLFQLKKQGFKEYFVEFWNWMDVIVICLSLVCIGSNFYRTFSIEFHIEELLQKPNEFADFEFFSYWQMQFNYGVAVTAFLAWAKVRTQSYQINVANCHNVQGFFLHRILVSKLKRFCVSPLRKR